MRTQRRHELRTNDLSAFLQDANDWAKKHSTQIGTVAVVAAVVLVGYILVKRSKASSADAAWQTMRGLSFTPAEAAGSFATLEGLIADPPNRDFKMGALLRKARSAIGLALGQEDGFHPEYLDEAGNAYRELLEGYQQRPAVTGTALLGLATIEESRFATDGDLGHRAKAEEYLNRLVNEPQFKGTPFQTEAARRLQEYDGTFQVIAMAEPEPLPPAPLDIGGEPRLEGDELIIPLHREPAPAATDPQSAAETEEPQTTEPGSTGPPSETGESPQPAALEPEPDAAAGSDTPSESDDR